MLTFTDERISDYRIEYIINGETPSIELEFYDPDSMITFTANDLKNMLDKLNKFIEETN